MFQYNCGCPLRIKESIHLFISLWEVGGNKLEELTEFIRLYFSIGIIYLNL